MNGFHDKVYTYEESRGQLKNTSEDNIQIKTWRNKITEKTKVKMQYMEVRPKL